MFWILVSTQWEWLHALAYQSHFGKKIGNHLLFNVEIFQKEVRIFGVGMFV